MDMEQDWSEMIRGNYERGDSLVSVGANYSSVELNHYNADSKFEWSSNPNSVCCVGQIIQHNHYYICSEKC